MQQERVGFYVHYHKFALAPHLAAIYPTHRRMRLASGSAEAAEVVLAQEALGSRMHGRIIEGISAPCQLCQKWVMATGIVKKIGVAPRYRSKTRMEARIHGL